MAPLQNLHILREGQDFDLFSLQSRIKLFTRFSVILICEVSNDSEETTRTKWRKKKKNPNFIQFINFFVKEKKKKNTRLPSKVWEGQTSFLTISLSRSDKIWIFSDILHGVNLSKMYNTSFIRHIMFSMSLGFCRHNRITSICKRRGGEEWAESF